MTDDEIKLIASTPITMDCFEMADFVDVCINDLGSENPFSYVGSSDVWEYLIDDLELLRQRYNKTKDKKYLKELTRLLPNSYKVVKL